MLVMNDAGAGNMLCCLNSASSNLFISTSRLCCCVNTPVRNEISTNCSGQSVCGKLNTLMFFSENTLYAIHQSWVVCATSKI